MSDRTNPLCTVCGDPAIGTLENIDGSKFRYCADHVADSNGPLLSPLLAMLRDGRRAEQSPLSHVV